MSEPINHHYVPQFYLRQFAAKDGRVFRYYRLRDKVLFSLHAPKGTGYKPNLYTLSKSADPQIIEKQFFGEIDKDAAPVLTLISSLGPNMVMLAGVLTDEQRVQWMRFIKSLLHRGPQSLAEIGAALEQYVSENMEREHGNAYRANRQPGDPASVYEKAKRESAHTVADAPKWLLTELIDEGPSGAAILNMIWAVLDLSDAPFSLLTCDRPYYPWDGLKADECLIHVALSPTKLFVAANNVGRLKTLAGRSAEDIVLEANDFVVKQAVRNVYANSLDHLRFVQDRLPKVHLRGVAARSKPPKPD